MNERKTDLPLDEADELHGAIVARSAADAAILPSEAWTADALVELVKSGGDGEVRFHDPTGRARASPVAA